ncbi:MAG: hypothetical protein JW850_01105 [Thermoflexales bacterium]|nr:hypothetical protein [Thermoflexales bacterium]
MSENLLKNPSFEGDTHHQTFAELNVPDGWTAFWYEGPATHDNANKVGYCRPEMRVIPDEPPFKSPNRVHSEGERPSPKNALMYFAFGKVMDAGVYQSVSVQPGAQLRATAWAHGWSNDGFNDQNLHRDDPRWSEGQEVGSNAFWAEAGTIGDDAARNMRFWIGIDPTGGADARAGTVVWGKAVHIYNTHAQLPVLEVIAQASQVTLFLRCDALWPYKHNDAYWDDAELTIVSRVPAQLSLQAAPVVGAARVGSAIMIEGGSSVPLAEFKLDVSGAAAAPQVFELEGGTAGEGLAWRWLLVPDQAGAYTIKLSAPGAEPVTARLQVAP